MLRNGEALAVDGVTVDAVQAGKGEKFCPFTDEKFQKACGYNNQAYELFLERRHLEQGLELVKEALALLPGNGTFLSTKAELLYAMGRYDEALEAIHEALLDNPGNSKFQEDLEMIYLEMEH